jgi:hypothetical protein
VKALPALLPALPAVLVASLSAACGGGGGDDEPSVGPVMVSGRVTYEDRAPMASGNLAGPVPVSARFVGVALITEDGANIGEAITAADGTFELTSTVDVTYGDSLHILAATTSADPARPIEVVRVDGNVHGFGGEGFEAAPSTNVDVLVTDSSDEAGAFNIYDQLLDAVDRVTALGETPEPLVAVWQRGSPGTFYDGDNNTMYLLGGSDDDSYDDSVILHEAGHWIEDTIGRSDSPGGGHDGSPTDPNLAWSEGFSTYWALAVLDAPLYIDTADGGGWSYDAESSVTRAEGDLGADISEDTVTEILWDLGDPAGDDDLAGAHDPVLLVSPEYLRTAALRNVGEAGVDLVDFLDGFFVGEGLASCAAVASIVTDTRDFAYDYAGPAGPCP